jgi:hypothetical protein
LTVNSIEEAFTARINKTLTTQKNPTIECLALKIRMREVQVTVFNIWIIYYIIHR